MGEAPLAEIKNEKDFEVWLRAQPREVAGALTARAALRVLPVVHLLEHEDDHPSARVLPVFRATGIAWTAAKYSAREKELATAARDAATAAETVVLSTHVGFVSRADAASRAAIRSAAFAAAAASGVGDPGAPRNALVFGARAIGYSDAITLGAGADINVISTEAGYWYAVSFDATQVEKGKTASFIANSPLWPQAQPERLLSFWQEMKAALHAEKQDWQVWTIWFDDRLAGRVRDEKRELAYVPRLSGSC